MKSPYELFQPTKELAEDILIAMVNSYAFGDMRGNVSASWYVMEGVATMMLSGYTQDETNKFLADRISSNDNIDPAFFVNTTIKSISDVRSKVMTLPDSFESINEYTLIASNVVDAIRRSYDIQ